MKKRAVSDVADEIVKVVGFSQHPQSGMKKACPRSVLPLAEPTGKQALRYVFLSETA